MNNLPPNFGTITLGEGTLDITGINAKINAKINDDPPPNETFGLDQFLWFHSLTRKAQKEAVAAVAAEHANRLANAFVRDETRFGNENAEVRARLRELVNTSEKLNREISRSASALSDKHTVNTNGEAFRTFGYALGRAQLCVQSLEFPEPVARKSEGWFSKDNTAYMTAEQFKVALYGQKVAASSRLSPGTALFVTPDQVPGLGKPLP